MKMPISRSRAFGFYANINLNFCSAPKIDFSEKNALFVMYSAVGVENRKLYVKRLDTEIRGNLDEVST